MLLVLNYDFLWIVGPQESLSPYESHRQMPPKSPGEESRQGSTPEGDQGEEEYGEEQKEARQRQ